MYKCDVLKTLRFKVFTLFKPKFELFANLMTVDIWIQPPDFQKELCDLRANRFLRSNAMVVSQRISETMFAIKFFDVMEFFSSNFIIIWKHVLFVNQQRFLIQI